MLKASRVARDRSVKQCTITTEERKVIDEKEKLQFTEVNNVYIVTTSRFATYEKGETSFMLYERLDLGGCI